MATEGRSGVMIDVVFDEGDVVCGAELIKDRLEDPKWLADYKKLIGDDNVFVAGNQTKTSVNQNFGQYVKIRLKAKNKLDASGKRVTRQVAGELVRTYTLLVRKS